MAITLDGNNANTVGVINSKTAVASTSGTSIDFTGIPAGVKRITVMFSGVSTNGSSSILIQLGDSGGIETTGYSGAAARFTNGASPTTATSSAGIIVSSNVAATDIISGSVSISLLSPVSNLFVAHGVVSRTDAVVSNSIGWHKALSDTLTQIRITTVNGTDTFDAGSINILYE